jgi:hypothetical protein
MFSELGGWLWFLIDVVMVLVLGIALVYGTMQWRRRGRPPGPMSESEAQRVIAEDRAAVKRAYEERDDAA